MTVHRIFVAAFAAGMLAALPAFAAPFGGAALSFQPTPRWIRIAEKVMPEIPAPGVEDQAEPSDTTTPDAAPGGTTTAPATPPANEVIPVVEYDFSKLPPPVQRIRDQIIEAASTGDIEKLKPVFEANGEVPQLSLNDIDDPVDYLKSLSGDPEGREILAILVEVLDAGYVHDAAGTPDDMYIWPYFARYPVDKLTPPQLVELFRLIYAGDYEDMKADGDYLFYRVGITPTGVWKYFIAGD